MSKVLVGVLVSAVLMVVVPVTVMTVLILTIRVVEPPVGLRSKLLFTVMNPAPKVKVGVPEAGPIDKLLKALVV